MTESNTSLRTARFEREIRLGALAVGIFLFAIALYYIDFHTAVGTIGELGVALPLALLFSGLWHLVRTWAWAWCFPGHGRTRNNTETVGAWTGQLRPARASAAGRRGLQLSDAPRHCG